MTLHMNLTTLVMYPAKGRQIQMGCTNNVFFCFEVCLSSQDGVFFQNHVRNWVFAFHKWKSWEICQHHVRNTESVCVLQMGIAETSDFYSIYASLFKKIE